MRRISLLTLLFSTLLVFACASDGGSVEPSECGDSCDEVWGNEVCPIDDGTDWDEGLDDDLGDGLGDEELGQPGDESPQGFAANASGLTDFAIEVVIGRDVVADVSQLAEQKARAEIRRQGGDLAWVNLEGSMNVGTGARLQQHVDAVMEGLRIGLEATDAHVDITAVYNYWQVRSSIVDIAGRMVRSFPYRGRVRWRIGCRIQDERGIIYRRLVAPMIDGAIWSFRSSASYRIEDFLEQHGLQDRMTVAIGTTRSWPSTTTITVRSKSGLFEPLTIPYSEIEKAVALIKQHLPQ
jgi:hypothetical protein